jgi:hypothetical protein
MSDSNHPVAVRAARPRRARGLVGWLYTSNPFYVISADLVFIGLRMSYDPSGRPFETVVLMVALLGYTLLLATTACLLIRLGRVWDDARTILLLVVAMFLAISISFDETLAGKPWLGVPCFLGGFLFAVAVNEGVLRCIRLRLPSPYRIPYYMILALFFLYPIALTPFVRYPESPRLQWLLFGFSPLAGAAFLCLVPAIRRGPSAFAKSGSPWPYPLYPWTLFGLLAAAVCGRASYLCVSFHFVGMSSRVGRFDCIFGPYFLIPFLLALGVLLIEAAVVSRRRTMQRVAMAVLPGVLLLAMIGHRPDPVFGGFLNLFRETLGGTPLFFSMIAVAALYAYSATRRIPLALAGLTGSLLALSVIGPQTLDLSGLTAPQPLPLLTAGGLQVALATVRRQSWRALLGSVCVIAAISIGLGRFGLEGHQTLVVFHLAILAAALVGTFFQDDLGRFLQWAASVLLASACWFSVWDTSDKLADVPLAWRQLYPLVAITAAVLYAQLTGCRFFLIAAWAGLFGWLAALGSRTYADLRRVVVGLDWIASGLAFFGIAAIISLMKTGLPARWRRTHTRTLHPPVADAE